MSARRRRGTAWGRLGERVAGWRRAARQEKATSLIEMAMMALIVSIALVSLTAAIRTATKGTLAAKERARAMALARDRLEEVKNMGYDQLGYMVSNYPYPDQPDPDNPLCQRKDVLPYPVVVPDASEDPWTPETILVGAMQYWRHVVVKFVREPGPGLQLVQEPEPGPGVAGGTDTSTDLAFIEVDITWFSRRGAGTKQVRLTTLLANTNIRVQAVGTASGSVFDDDCRPLTCISDGIDDPPDTVALPAAPGPDDTRVSTSVVVVAHNVNTNQEYSVKTSNDGRYTVNGLPNGSYLVEVQGAPAYHDSAYTGNTSPPTGTILFPRTVTVSPGTPDVGGVNIWTTKVRTFAIRGRFIGKPAGEQVRVSANDGLSVPVGISVTAPCDSSPCWFELPYVAWPSTGHLWYTVWFENLTKGTMKSATLCVDATGAPSTFYVGEDPSSHPPGPNNVCTGGCATSPPPGSLNCVAPAWTKGAIDVSSGGGYLPARVRVKVREYYDGQVWDLAYPGKTMVNLDAPADGVSITMTVNGSGVTIFAESATCPGPGGWVPVEAAGSIKVTAFVTTPGWTSESFVLPFDVDSNGCYDLEMGGAAYPSPVDSSQRNTFVLKRISEICGTVWSVAGSKPLAGAQVRIKNETTQWSQVFTTDSQGQFSCKSVPQETSPYTVAPVLGLDYVSTPADRTVKVGANGLIYRTDTATAPLEFTLNRINGIIKGTVSKSVAGNPVRTGAVVIASTYAGALPDTLPSAALAGQYTYSTVTLTDGTYRLKVATGVGSYYLSAYMMKDGVLYSYPAAPPGAAVTATSGGETTVDILIP